MTIIWHNARCAKSRETLKLLEEAGESPTVRDYQKQPPMVDELAEARDLLGIHTIQMVRVDDPLFDELGLADADDEGLLAALSANPSLIERPIVFKNGKAAIGRPPENVRAIL